MKKGRRRNGGGGEKQEDVNLRRAPTWTSEVLKIIAYLIPTKEQVYGLSILGTLELQAEAAARPASRPAAAALRPPVSPKSIRSKPPSPRRPDIAIK